MKLAVVGVTGMVGQEMLKVLEEMKFKIDDFVPVASERSIGKNVLFNGNSYKVIGLQDAIYLKPDIAIFSAGGNISTKWAPKFAEVGTTVIDNSSAWRMDKTITGTGMKAMQQLENEYEGKSDVMAYNYQIHQNAIPHCDDFLENGYTKEEMKLVNETNKIFNSDISITATAVRIPVMGGHSESINITLENPFDLNELISELKSFNGLEIKDDITNNIYPMPFYSRGSNNVYVGRIRKDFSCENSLNLWVVADNLRKGAATNAVQIAKLIVKNNLIN